MTINDVEFSVDVNAIIDELVAQLRANKIQYIQKTIDTPRNLQLCCPYHKDGMERRPSAGIKKSDGTFHCFRDDTKVLTSKGSFAIKDIVNKDVEVLNGDGVWEKTVFTNYGKTNLIKLVLFQDQQYKTIYTTASHQWFVHKKSKIKRTDELKVNEYLQSYIGNRVDYAFNLDGFIHGVIFGDGSRHLRYKTYGHKHPRVIDRSQIIGCDYSIRIPKFTKKNNLISFFRQQSNIWNITDLQIDGKDFYNVVSKRFKPEHNFKIAPNLSESKDYLMSFLSGYFACDGCFKSSLISCANFDMLNIVRDICIHCGILVRDIKTIEHITNYSNNQTTFIHNLPLLRSSLPTYFYVLENHIAERKYNRSRWRVVSIETTDLCEDVYCCQTSTQSFVLDGNILTHNCMACGEVHSLPEMISHCFGKDDGGLFGWTWLLKNFASVEVENRKSIELDYERKPKAVKKQQYVTEEELDRYRYYHEYWTKRKITDNALIELFDLGYDKETDCITMPNKDINGNCVFVARRSTKTKYFNYPKEVKKPVYGLYEIKRVQSQMMQNLMFMRPGVDLNFGNEIIICESMIDALTCWEYGKPAVALNGLGTEEQFKQLRDFPCRKYIIATDMDERGLQARDNIKRALKGKIVTEYKWNLADAKDINDMSKEYFDNLKEYF